MTAAPPPGPADVPGRRGLPLQPVRSIGSVGVLDVAWRRVAVQGGELGVAVWGEVASAPQLAVAVHGLTGNALVWAGVAGLLDGDPPLVAPDLRGRGSSRDLAGPSGLAGHADDVLAVLDVLGRDRVVLLGHGTGALVAAEVAERQPDRVSRLVLVDPDGPEGVETGAELAGPFADREAHRAAWRRHTRLGEAWNRLGEAVVAHDAVVLGCPAAAGPVQTALRLEVVRAEADEVAGRERTSSRTPVPTTVVSPGPAGRSPGDPQLEVVVSGAGHWSLLLGLRGADAVSRAVLAGSGRAGATAAGG